VYLRGILENLKNIVFSDQYSAKQNTKPAT
jgi:hypothetical protein